MADRRSGPVPLGEVLRERFRSLGWETRLQQMEIFQRWEEAVGSQIARRARPVQIRNGRLTVAVENPSWAQQLSFLRKELLQKIEATVGKGLVKEIYLVSGQVEPSAGPAGAPEPSRAEADPLVAEAAEEEASRIPDGELREAFRRVLLAASRRRDPPQEAPRPERGRRR